MIHVCHSKYTLEKIREIPENLSENKQFVIVFVGHAIFLWENCYTLIGGGTIV
jgi:hypothetical protein